MNNLYKKIQQLYKETLEKRKVTDVYDMTGAFYDEPQVFFYTAPKNTEYKFYNDKAWDIVGTGGSFTSREEALLKALVEVNEKLVLMLFNPKEIVYTTYNKIKSKAINPAPYVDAMPTNRHSHLDINNIVFGWESAFNLTTNKTGLIPSQLIHPNYFTYAQLEKENEEPLLLYQTQVFNGSGGGFEHYSVLLRAIYELVERDTHRNLVLTKSIPPMVNLVELNNQQINKIINICNAYRLQLTVYDITNDLGVPSFMTLLVDPTCVGPILNFGFKAGLDVKKTILQSIQDVFYSRFGYRQIIYSDPTSPLLIYLKKICIQGKVYKNNVYLKKTTFERLSYLFSKKITCYSKLNYPRITNELPKKNLQIILDKFAKKNFEIWYKILSNDFNSKSKLLIYKAIIPGLQPQASTEVANNFFRERLKSVREYYHNEK